MSTAMVTDRSALAVLLLVGVCCAAAPSTAHAALSAHPALETRDGAARLLVTLSSTRAFSARTRPRGVRVSHGASSFVLRRSAAGGELWSTPRMRAAKALALLALAGKRIAIHVRTRAGTTTLQRRVPMLGASPVARPPVSPPPPPGTPPPPPPPPPADVVAPTAPKREQALAVAQQYVGTAYVWGGSTPETGFDASGLVQYAYRQVGIALPRSTDQQYLVGVATARDALLPGDLVFFRDPGGSVHHVGIFSGGAQFLHAPHTGDVVRYSSLDEPYYASQFAGGRRVDG